MGELSKSSASSGGSLGRVEVGRRVDEYEVGVVRAREPHQVRGRGVACERRRPRFRPVRTDRGGRGRQLVLSRNEPCHDELGPHEVRELDERADAIVARRRDEDNAGARRRRRGSELERGVVPEDGPLERLQRRGRIEPEGLDQQPPRRTVDLQGFGLSSGAVEREHQLAAGPLAQRMRCDECLELGHDAVVAPEHKLRLEAVLQRRQAQLLQPLNSGSRERLVRQVGEGRSPPDAERLAEQRDRRSIVAAASRARCLRGQALEAGEVELLRRAAAAGSRGLASRSHRSSPVRDATRRPVGAPGSPPRPAGGPHRARRRAARSARRGLRSEAESRASRAASGRRAGSVRRRRRPRAGLGGGTRAPP